MNDSNKNLFHLLDNDTLLEVLKKISLPDLFTLSATCKHLRHLILNEASALKPKLFPFVSLNKYERLATSNKLESLLSQIGQQIEILKMNFYPTGDYVYDSYHIPTLISTYCNPLKLKQLYLSKNSKWHSSLERFTHLEGISLSSNSLSDIDITKFPRLKWISGGSVTDHQVEVLAAMCPDLIAIDAWECGSSVIPFKQLLETCKQFKALLAPVDTNALVHLIIQDNQLTFDCTHYSTIVEVLKGYFSRLERIEFHTETDSETLQLLLQSLTHLKIANLQYFPFNRYIGDAIIKGCPNLKELNVSIESEVTINDDIDFSDTVDASIAEQKLQMDRQSLISVIESCTKLKRVALSEFAVDNTVLQRLVDLRGHQLTHLTLYAPSDHIHVGNLVTLLTQCTNLDVLSMTDVPIYYQLMTDFEFPKLRVLHIDWIYPADLYPEEEMDHRIHLRKLFTKAKGLQRIELPFELIDWELIAELPLLKRMRVQTEVELESNHITMIEQFLEETKSSFVHITVRGVFPEKISVKIPAGSVHVVDFEDMEEEEQEIDMYIDRG